MHPSEAARRGYKEINMIGTIINTAAVILGGSLGLVIKKKLPERYQDIFFQGVGLFTLALGIKMAMDMSNAMFIILSLIIGGILGEALKLEEKTEFTDIKGHWAEREIKELSEKGKLPKKSYKLLEEAFEIFKNIYEEPQSPVLIHGDLNIMNIMADTKTLELTAFIDPCGSIWADKEYDLFQLRNMWGDAYGLYETYKSNSEISEFTDFRVGYYASMHEAAMRLKGGLIMPLWEDLNNARLKREIKKLKEKM